MDQKQSDLSVNISSAHAAADKENKEQDKHEKNVKKHGLALIKKILKALLSPILTIISLSGKAGVAVLKSGNIIIHKLTNNSFVVYITESRFVKAIKISFKTIRTKIGGFLKKPQIKMKVFDPICKKYKDTTFTLEDISGNEDLPAQQHKETEPSPSPQIGGGKEPDIKIYYSTVVNNMGSRSVIHTTNISFNNILLILDDMFSLLKDLGLHPKKINKNNTLRRLWKKNKKINVFKWKNIACNTNSIVQISKENKNNELLIIVEERKKRSRRRKRKKKGKQSRKKKHKRKKN